MIGVWTAYKDKNFSQQYKGSEFQHEDMITREGWTRMLFKGIFETDEAYLKLEIRHPQTNMLIKTFYFKFRKGYQTSLDGKTYVKNPILDEKIVKDGYLEEIVKTKNSKGEIVYRLGHVQYYEDKLVEKNGEYEVLPTKCNAIWQTSVRYTEKPKAIFVVTPPHLAKYAKIILILLKQLIDLNFDQAYLGKKNQKPLLSTRFVLDEVGLICKSPAHM